MFARFICATILHLSCVDEVNAGLNMMKYAVNHSYKFNSFWFAFLSGMFQYTQCLCVELANIGVICAATDTISIVFNFIALAIIIDFDDYVFGSLKNESFKGLIERDFTKNVLVINHTTSKKCKVTELSTVRDEQGELRPLKLRFCARSIPNMFLYVVYKILRTFYVSTFFYFFPFTTVVLSTLLPLSWRTFAANIDPNSCS